MTQQLTALFSVTLVVLLLAVDAQQCANGGTPVNATDCQCPAYVAGRLCETVKCQRWGIHDKDRCACAPGWYDKYCGIRGCRPPNEDNLDHSKRSLIIVFNMKTSMKDQLESLKSNFKNMVAGMQMNRNLQNMTENWIENYIVYGFVASKQKSTYTQMTSENADDVLTFLGKMQLYDGDDTQPVLAAVKQSQQLFPQMKSHAIVLVFTDSPASDAVPWSHRFGDGNLEQLNLQISFLWRSKVSFILSLPSGADTTKDGVDVYRRLSMSTHGDYFHVSNAAETSDILNNIVTTFFFPENVGVGFEQNQDLSVVPTADQGSDYVFTLLTKDMSTEDELPNVYGSQLIAKGANYKLFAGQYLATVDTAQSKGNYNFRVYLQSKNTLLFDYNSDMMIDVGNGIVHLGVVMHSTIRTFGFSQFTNMTYRVFQNGKQVREDFKAFKRPQEDCTFEWAFDPWVNTNDCPPGPITQVHVLNYNGFYKARVTPGYCDQIAHYQPEIQGYVVPEIKLQENEYQPEIHSRAITPVQTCPVTNIDAINDPRMDSPNQYIFILEQNVPNRDIYQTLVKEIDQIVALTNTSTVGSYKKEYTLIVHNDESSRVLLSTYNPNTFVAKFKTLVTGMMYNGFLNKPMGLMSIVQAQKLNIKPMAQAYFFTNQAVKSVQNVTRRWDIVNRDIEFNFFTIADGLTTEIFALPWQLELVQKMSNGRIIPLGAKENTLVNVFADIMPMTALTTDNEKYDCHTAPYTLDAFVETENQGTVFQFVGTGLNSIQIKDAAGKDVPVDSSTTFQNANFKSLNIDSSKFTPGKWSVSVSAARGGCQITVRHKSSNGVLLGFTSKVSSDTVATQIPSQRTTVARNEMIYTAIRIKQNSMSKKASSSNVEIQVVNRTRYDKPTTYQSLIVLQRDPATCSYNFITPSLSMPKNELLTFTLTSNDDSGNLILRRILYYYQHSPADTSICHGGEVDMYGQCVCPQRYTGEYCWDRICAPGATLSYGICSCSSGFYGDFCELELLMPNATTPTTPGYTGSTQSSWSTMSSTFETTTKSSSGFSCISILLAVFVLWF